jgi:hypothetical protein
MRKDRMTGVIAVLAACSVLASGQQTFEPDHVTVQHILIAFQGTIPGSSITRTRDEAEALARQIFARARMGEDFDALVKEFTNDEYPGIYNMSNTGVEPDVAIKEFPRAKMVKAFGDVGFRLRIGEIGLAEYDAAVSKYGWHIVKRLK